ncbi:PREDICTED: low affinity immunoglobulin epsilon Fc receptor-like [Branchiostoma belcheri]|uniref:Low affinity immunoglobulin epsilon Fc receptor-like n=1 Tax=Branchiostoma belcheri TaxID=7741 RepID=A0A6P4XZY7_BRABE|nr:PREDICTED: low affinity immunoglobulin epsilon Fc receptor-like [Branchiostoma belcheri]
MYEQAEPVRSPFSGPDSRKTSEPPQARPVRQSGSRGRVRHGNGSSEDQETSSHMYEEAEEVKRYATSADGAYPGGASGRRGVCSFLYARRSSLAAGIAVLLSLGAVGLAPLTFSNKQEISQLSNTVEVLKREQDGMRQLSSTVDGWKRDQDDTRQLSTTVDGLKRDQDDMSATVDGLKRVQDALKRDLDNERSRTAALEQCLHEIEKALPPCPEGYTLRRGTCYKAFNTRKSFNAAAVACLADSGTLAMPRDAETNAFLVSLYKSLGDGWSFWFGLHDQREEGKFEWVDDSALGTYNSWAPGEPNNYGGGQDCVLYAVVLRDKWSDNDCRMRFRFICQTAPGRP